MTFYSIEFVEYLRIFIDYKENDVFGQIEFIIIRIICRWYEI